MFDLTPFTKLRNDLSKVTDNFPFYDWPAKAMSPFVAAFPIEMWEDSAKVYIEADLPGITAEDLDVSVCSDRKLRIAASRQNRTEKSEGTTHYREVSYGHIERLVALPECVNEETVDARLKNGVLTVTLNKRAGTQTRKIEVKS
jgi:HSP20 family protein